jgi:hypothetical protein
MNGRPFGPHFGSRICFSGSEGRRVGTVDRYLPAIMSFLWNDMAPEDAVAMIEEANSD